LGILETLKDLDLAGIFFIRSLEQNGAKRSLGRSS
jgi:hypothetical protein